MLVRSILCDIIKFSVWLKRWVGSVIFCLILKEFIRLVNVSFNVLFVLLMWILKFFMISVLLIVIRRFERKFVNFFRNFVYGFGGLYIVVRVRDILDFFCMFDRVIFSISILKELNLYFVFWVILRILLYIVVIFFLRLVWRGLCL